MFALTGWIPERVPIRPGTKDFNSDAQFDRMRDGLKTGIVKCNEEIFLTQQEVIVLGDILITVATGELDQAECDRTGLVSTHAYAVLDVRDVLVCGTSSVWSCTVEFLL